MRARRGKRDSPTVLPVWVISPAGFGSRCRSLNRLRHSQFRSPFPYCSSPSHNLFLHSSRPRCWPLASSVCLPPVSIPQLVTRPRFDRSAIFPITYSLIPDLPLAPVVRLTCASRFQPLHNRQVSW